MPYQPHKETLEGYVITNDATPIELVGYQVEPDSAIRFRTEIMLVRLVDGVMRLFDRKSIAIRGSGNAVIRANGTPEDIGAAIGAEAIGVSINGPNISLMATGIAGTELLWFWKTETWQIFETE